jgi:hypothetical protein
MNNNTLIIYYIFVLAVLALTGYAVFVLNASGWWFCLASIVMGATPESNNDKHGL